MNSVTVSKRPAPSSHGQTPLHRERGGRKPGPMELIASVSRSSGLEKGGDALKDFAVQKEYRGFIQGKLDDIWSRYPHRHHDASGEQSRQRLNAQENCLILFRKLREGIVSSKRNDSFALEVYETSSYLAVLFDSPRQATSIFTHLVPDLYLTSPTPHHNRLPTILISLLHHLLSAYPSQSLFFERLYAIPRSIFPRDTPAYVWLSSLTSSLRSRNYVKFEELTRPTAFAHLINASSLSVSSYSSMSLSEKAFHTLVDTLRRISRNTAWSVIRGAYRELSFRVESEGTRDWLMRSLTLRSVIPETEDIPAEEWLEGKTAEGHVRPKEGVEGKYIICKIR